MRLIDADGVMDEIKRNKLLAREPATERCMEIIKNATTYAEPPRKCGEWIEDKFGYNACSECGYEWDTPEYNEAKYCPQCGARMDTENQHLTGAGHPAECREVRVLERIGSTPTRAWCKTPHYLDFGGDDENCKIPGYPM